MTALPDSGRREQFVTGAVRDARDGKGRYDLITPFGIARLAKHYENGAAKYEDRNWEKGMPITRCVDSAIRHLFQYLAGDDKEDHLAAAAWNTLGAIHMEEMIARGVVPSVFAEGLGHYEPKQLEMGDLSSVFAGGNPQ